MREEKVLQKYWDEVLNDENINPEDFIPYLSVITLGIKIYEIYSHLKKHISEMDTIAEIASIISIKTSEYINKDFDENKSHKKLFISFSYKRKSMLTALEWGYESDVIPNQSFRFVLKFIALEALLGDKKDIVETLKNRCAFLLAETHKEREELLTEIPKLYELRSKLVHGSGSLLGFENHEKLNNLNDILKRVIYSELFMLHGK